MNPQRLHTSLVSLSQMNRTGATRRILFSDSGNISVLTFVPGHCMMSTVAMYNFDAIWNSSVPNLSQFVSICTKSRIYLHHQTSPKRKLQIKGWCLTFMFCFFVLATPRETNKLLWLEDEISFSGKWGLFSGAVVCMEGTCFCCRFRGWS